MSKLVRKVSFFCMIFCLIGFSFAQDNDAESAVVADIQEVAVAQADIPVAVMGTDEYTGWKYSISDQAVVENADVRIKLNAKKGTFALYSLNEKGKAISLLSPYNSNSESYYMLKIGRKQYKLCNKGQVSCEARKTSSGVQMVYTVAKKAYFALDFSFPESEVDDSLQNVVRVTMYTVNIGETPQSFAIKAIFDTILGETSGIHFKTAVNSKLDRQKHFHDMKEDKWIRSASRNTAIQFMLDGEGITVPEAVSVTSKESLEKYWIPEAIDGKGFNTAASYNNSGLGINWKTCYLNPQEMDVKTFYISIAEGLAPIYVGKEPAGMELLSALQNQEKVFDVLPVYSPEEKHSVVELSPAAQAVTEEQLDPEYIQNLIDYIESIKSEEDIENEELDSLNLELDAIFEKLRSME